jgi:aryl-alcohol dehydrogenase-like predicted oxidoreductase
MPCLGLGCFPLGGLAKEEDGVAVVAGALASGARYFDTAPSYGDGESERRIGKGLAGFVREELWIATKTLERDGDAALAELERSLERLRTGYVDCVQVHEVRSAEGVEGLFVQGGVIAALESAREKKKIRHVGITGHRDPAFLVQAIERYAFATALVPVNPLDGKHRSFVKDFLPKAREKGVGVIAMKVYAGGALLREGSKVQADELVRYALAQKGVCVAVPGADSIAHWDEARAAAVEALPDAAAQAELAKRVGPHEGKKSEWYKNP